MDASVVRDDGFTLPNGLGWSLDDGTMYLVDSMPRVLYAYEFHADEGVLRHRRVLAEFGERDGLPDGLAVDAGGGIWIAFHGGSCLRRLDPAGRIVDTIGMPVSQPTSCAFGEGTDLFVTSARQGLDDERLAGQPMAGSLFHLDAGVAGAPVGA